MESPLGPLTVWANETGITALEWGKERESGEETPVLADAKEQLGAYFDGTRQDFDLPLAPKGSAFQLDFLAALSAIPFGETRTYGDLAKDLGVPPQAVGQACGANPIPIIIPCHRVLAADSLGGFSGAGGVEAKVWLLKHEGAASLLI